ncbi:alanine--tRNA ligase [Candidatus Woesearchaeota archaeon]|nr:alanine--tRNA ligase [Candidatus Woesearchaeota archaeon]
MAIDKSALRAQFNKNWKKYYNLRFFKQEGFIRKKCSSCGVNFWTQEKDRKVCNDTKCSDGFTFIGKTPAKKSMDYQETWEEFSRIMTKQGYTEIPRYPVIARWRDDTWFTQASIYCFQPHVVSGEVSPPANPLIIPQPSLRFNDIDNVGITNSHYTCHIHMGQHAFVPPKKFDQSAYLKHIYAWLTKGMRLPGKEITFHEDVWAGGGNFGPSLEFFSRGIELGNQVYMMFKNTPKGFKPLDINVLDMGAGLERAAWFTHGTPTSYEVAFDPVDDQFRKKIGLKYNKKLLSKFSRYAGFLNVDEVKNIEKAWKNVAKKIDVDVKELKKNILPIKAFYSVLDHSRTLLFALADGALPSNSGGGYNLRFILRRALRFIEEFGWDINLTDLTREHVRAFTGQKPRQVTDTRGRELVEVGLHPMFGQLQNKLPDVGRILKYEEKKFNETKKRNRKYLSKYLKKKKKIQENDLIKLYDSKGILPEDIKNIEPKIKIPADFYSKVAERHVDKTEEKYKVISKTSLKGIEPTYELFRDAEQLKEFDAKVLEIVDNRYVILNETAFYPTSGGQLHDIGTINGCPVVNVEKWGKHIAHEVENINFKKSAYVIGKIDWTRRASISRNHTATHIINGVARRILGYHIWQAGSEVRPEKARLDITHFDNLTETELKRIELLANQIVLSDLPINKFTMSRDKAEKKYGFRLYQGGAVPGAELRIIETPGFDVEACGGIHINRTSQAGLIKILRSKKIQDGVIRIEFTSGTNAIEEIQKQIKYLEDSSNVFSVQPKHLPKTCKRFFKEWKDQRKQLRKLKK